MPTENDKTNTPTAEKALEEKLAAKVAETKAASKDELKGLRAENADLKRRIAELEKAGEAEAEAGEADNYVVLRGKRYDIERTVEARFASDEARKGYIDLEAELVVLKR